MPYKRIQVYGMTVRQSQRWWRGHFCAWQVTSVVDTLRQPRCHRVAVHQLPGRCGHYVYNFFDAYCYEAQDDRRPPWTAALRFPGYSLDLLDRLLDADQIEADTLADTERVHCFESLAPSCWLNQVELDGRRVWSMESQMRKAGYVDALRPRG